MRTTTASRCIALVLTAVLLSSCAHAPRTAGDALCTTRTLTRLYFGSRMPDGTHVDTAVWQRFVDDRIAPVAPEGFTVIEGTGAWREATGLVRETTRIVEVVRTPDAASTRAWRAVADAYVERFEQQSVLQTHQAVEACF